MGQLWQAVFGHQLVFTFEGLLVASVIFNLPFAIQPTQRGFEAIPLEVREAAACCGMSPWRSLWRVELPLAWPGVLTAMVLTFAHTLGEFGIVLMVGGSIPGETKTIAIAIYDRVQAFDMQAPRSCRPRWSATFALHHRRDLLPCRPGSDGGWVRAADGARGDVAAAGADSARRRLRVAPGELLALVGPFRLGQDHAPCAPIAGLWQPADARVTRGTATIWLDTALGPGAAAPPTPGRDRVPELRAVPAHDGGRGT